MGKIVAKLVLICSIFHCEGLNYEEEWNERLLADSKEESHESDEIPSRRFETDTRYAGTILGVPSLPGHLPEAEPIQPGHTLIRPSLGMLKSSIKFPHNELENGAGVYGNVDNWGIKYDGKNERVLYSGFRRTRTPADYIVLAPLKSKSPNSKFIMSSVVLDLDRDKDVGKKLLHALQLVKQDVYPSTTRILQKYIIPYRSSIRPPNKKLQTYGSNKRNLEDTFREGQNEPNDPDSDSAVASEENVQTAKSLELHQDHETKQSWFWNSKNVYNNIKINQDAPDHSELMPVNVSNGIRNWWFYHQDDYHPFEKNED